MDFMACVSYGVYPTPGVTTTRRAALAVSMGLLNITLPAGITESTRKVSQFLKAFMVNYFL